MSKFNAKMLNVNNINSGQKYQNDNVLQASALNEIVEGILYNSQEKENINIIAGEGIDSIVQKYSGKVDETHYGNTSTGESAAVFGEANENSANRVLMAGKLNKNFGANHIVGGLYNKTTEKAKSGVTTGYQNINNHENNILGGLANKDNAPHTVLGGAYNEITERGTASVGGGQNNKINAENTIWNGHDNIIDAINGSAFGYGLICRGLPCKCVVGRYNNPKSNTIFEVGIGTSDTDRSNAFEVYEDGSWWSASRIYHLRTVLNSNEYVQLDETDTLAFASILQDQMKLLNFKNVAVVIRGEEGVGYQPFINLSISRTAAGEIKFSYEGLFCNLEIIANITSRIITAKIL